MGERLQIPSERMRIIPNGINLDGYDRSAGESSGKARNVLGYFARMCPEKGLDVLIDAFLILRERSRVRDVKLRIGGYCSDTDERFVNKMRMRLKAHGSDAEFCPNLSRAEKLDFLQSLSVFSTPAAQEEAFGLYVVEAMASGVPVVQPAHGAFPELIAATGGGVLCAPGEREALAESIERLLLDRERARLLGESGRKAVFEKFSADRMAEAVAGFYLELVNLNRH
jgi:glycosyltransferase involved in cell wall biosynthesis